jgi:plasmid stabilization system protein ParE
VRDISQDRPATAARVAERILGTAALLGQNPRLGRRIEDLVFTTQASGDAEVEIRSLQRERWGVVYRVDDTRVTIIAVFDVRKSVEHWLEAESPDVAGELER